MALVDQSEREAISRRSKQALAVARARGIKLGKPNGAKALRRAGKGGVALRAAAAVNADGFAGDLAGVVADVRGARQASLRAIAVGLIRRGIQIRRGEAWQMWNVKVLLDRLTWV
ncbi:hypothetical protein [Cypionkella psychrotolerans]|uniref:hypothetical protein n=1 Tax=Cypionkella psychrotolerans TaxID=1678131 RepID=UPI0006B5A4A2|nr:hypothetical protein [Cypionkella psychrotolerans]